MPPLFLSALEFGVALLLGLAFVLRIWRHPLPRSRIGDDQIAKRLAIAAFVADMVWYSTNLVYAIIAQIQLHNHL